MDFTTAFHALTGHEPMKWQERLFGLLAKGQLPSALDLPTGLGKTSVIAIWLIARAFGAPLPRRLVYIVDRRAVVDQATDVAETIALRLGHGSDLPELICRLREGLHLQPGQRLPISTLRGQHADNRAWLEAPTATAIVVGTVDMIGSRLLFEGYGVSSGMRPVHAALLGTDALAVLDEAHLVPPFEALLRNIAECPRPAPVPPFHLLTLSATGRAHHGLVFRLTPDDEADKRTEARLGATKRLDIATATDDLVETMVNRAISRAEPSQRVIVFCDSRKMAQRVADLLKKRAREHFGRTVDEPALLVGARRVREREELKKDSVFRRFLAGSSDEASTGPAFLVATSAGEVGVDLDADHMVCDLVPWERMVQRMGRVNRRRDPGFAFVDVFVAEPESDAESGAISKNALLWRAPFESSLWSVEPDGRRDASPRALSRLKDNPDMASLMRAATTPEPLRPALTLPLLQAWSMTSLKDHPGRPKVEPWLRGWVDDEPQTRVVWRMNFPIRPHREEDDARSRRDCQRFFESAPPHLSEVLDVPTSQIVDVLRKRSASWVKAEQVGDPPLVAILDAKHKLESLRDARWLHQSKGDDVHREFVGRTIVVDATLGGLSDAGLLDDKNSEPPITLDGDRATWGIEQADAAGFRVRRVQKSEEPDPEWPIEFRWSSSEESEDEEELRVEVLRKAVATRGDAALAKEPQALADHHKDTAAEARRIATDVGLRDEFVGLVVAAAAIHDAGKAATLWQNAMRAPRDGRPYAKTKGGGHPKALEVDGETYRHEFGSLAEAEHDPAVLALPPELQELALHLVAAHHGFARPVIAAVDPEVPPSIAIERARGVARRFAQLQSVWGPFGLAWWESLLRAADWSASRKHNERKAKG